MEPCRGGLPVAAPGGTADVSPPHGRPGPSLHVPQHDTLAFTGRHAISEAGEAMELITAWLRKTMVG